MDYNFSKVNKIKLMNSKWRIKELKNEGIKEDLVVQLCHNSH